MPTDSDAGVEESPNDDLALLRSISQSVDLFEEELKAGKSPRIESHLQGWKGHGLAELFAELFSVEMEYRGRRGERPTVAEYQERFPEYLKIVAQEFPSDLGNYELLELRGIGAFGRVYRGRIKGTRICHAVKLLYHVERASDLESAKEEFEALANLHHPAIVTAHNFNLDVKEGCLPYIVMEYVEGESLQEKLRSERLPIHRAISLVCAMAEALAAAHSAGIIHRDLKPSNILLDGEGRPHITDLGLALLSGDRHLRKDELAGTIAYFSPEQVRHESLDPRSDIWSLGVIFYEALTGERPFQGASKEELFDQILSLTVASPRALRPDVPARLDLVCLRCLEKDREKRWTTARDLADALKSYDSTITETLKRPATRRRSFGRFATVTASLLVLICIGLLYRFAPWMERGLQRQVLFLPSSWNSVTAIEPAGDLLYLGGIGTKGPTLGAYQDGRLSDLSAHIPPSWGGIQDLAFGDSELMIGGWKGLPRTGSVALYSPSSGNFQELTAELRGSNARIFKYGGVHVAYGDGRFVLGAAGNDTSLSVYSLPEARFRPVPTNSYVAVNTISAAGDSFLIAGAGEGGSSSVPPALGWISTKGDLSDLTGDLFMNWGMTERSAYSGSKFFLQGLDRVTGTTQMFALFDPSQHLVANIYYQFPASFKLHSLAGGNGYFLLGGEYGQAYLARYTPGNAAPVVLTAKLPEGALDVTAVKVAGDKNVVAGVGRDGRAFVEAIPDAPR